MKPGLYFARTADSDWWNRIIEIHEKGYSVVSRHEQCLSTHGNWKGDPRGYLMGPRIEEPGVDTEPKERGENLCTEP